MDNNENYMTLNKEEQEDRKIVVSAIPALDTRSLADKVETMLIQLLIDKKLKPGDSIPKELDLAQAMGVSRTVIREALSRLRTSGIVESKKHRGAILISPNLSNVLSRSLIPTMLDKSTLKDLFELRLILEVGMADIIYNQITEEDIAELKQLVQGQPAKVDANTLFEVDHEIKFHGKLYEITKNKTLKDFQLLLFPIFRYVYEMGVLNPSPNAKPYVSHKGLVDELEKGDPNSFRIAMRDHLDNHFRRLFELK